MALLCRTLDSAAVPAWDRFVEAMPNGTFFHRAAWAEVFERGFGHTPHYAYTERDGAITGVLPLVHVKTALFGNDPNWGRILCAAGYSGVPVDPSRIGLVLCGCPLLREGQPLPFDESAVSRAMKAPSSPSGISGMPPTRR